MVFLHPFSLLFHLAGGVAHAVPTALWLQGLAGSAATGTAMGVLTALLRRRRLVASRVQERLAVQAVSAIVPDPSKLTRYDTYVHAAVGFAVGSLMGSVGAVSLTDLFSMDSGSESPILATMAALGGAGAGGAGAAGGLGDWFLLFVLVAVAAIAVGALIGLLTQAALAAIVSGAVAGGIKGLSKSLAAGIIEHYEPTPPLPPPPPIPRELELDERIREFLMSRRLRSRHPSPFVDEIERHMREMNARSVDDAIERWLEYAPKAAASPLVGDFVAFLSASRSKWPPKPPPPPPHYPDYPQRREWAVNAMLDGARTGAITGAAIAAVDLLLTWYKMAP